MMTVIIIKFYQSYLFSLTSSSLESTRAYSKWCSSICCSLWLSWPCTCQL